MVSLFDGTGAAWLIETALEISVVLGLAWLFYLALGRAEARSRAIFLSATLVGVLFLPALTIALPSLRLPVFPSLLEDGAVALSKSEAGEKAPGVVYAGAAPPATEPVESGASGGWGWQGWLFALWLVGVGGVLVWLLVGLALANRFVRTATPLNGKTWRQWVRQSRKDLSLRGEVRVLKNASVPTPMTWGVFRPVVLMPAEAVRWPGERQRIVLLHELVHVKRKDWLVLLLSQLCCALYWFHPLVWVSVRRLAVERECACDDDVIALGTKPSSYARHLVDVARRMTAHSMPLSTVSMASCSKLEERVRAVLARRSRYRRREKPMPAVVSVLCLIALLALVHPFADAKTPEEEGTSTPTSVASSPPSGEVDPPPAPAEENSPEPIESTTDEEGATSEPSNSEKNDPDSDSDPDQEPVSEPAEPASGDEEEGGYYQRTWEEKAMDRAQGHMAEQRWERAEELYREILRKNLQNGEAWYFLGWTLMNQGRYEEALKVLRRAIRHPERRASAYYLISVILCGENALDEAMRALEDAVDAGFDAVDFLKADERLHLLRDRAGYQSIVEELESRSGE